MHSRSLSLSLDGCDGETRPFVTWRCGTCVYPLSLCTCATSFWGCFFFFLFSSTIGVVVGGGFAADKRVLTMVKNLFSVVSVS